MVASRSRTYASGYGDLTHGCKEEVGNLRILVVNFDSKLTFETDLQEVESKAARSLDVCRAGELFDWSRVLKRCFNAYILSSLEYCVPIWMWSEESLMSLLISVVCRAEKLCEGELCCLGHRKVSALYLLYMIYHREDHPLHEYLHPFVAARNTRG